MYPPELVKPMIEELTAVGFEELKTAEAVREALKRAGTTLVVVNSVCGCAARNARPAVIYSLQNAKKPDHLPLFLLGSIERLLKKLVTLCFLFLPPLLV